MPDSKEKFKQKIRAEQAASGYLTDEDIRRIRKKLGLTQKQMEQTLGVGKKTFARYENLSVRQSKAMDNLLRILDAYPETIKILDINTRPKGSKKEK